MSREQELLAQLVAVLFTGQVNGNSDRVAIEKSLELAKKIVKAVNEDSRS